VRGEVVPVTVSAPDDERIAPLQALARRAVTDDDLRPRQRQAEKVLEALLDRDAADVKPDGAGQLVHVVAPVPWVEEPRVDAARPVDQPVADVALLQLAQQRHRADQRVLGALVKPPHQLVAPLERNRQPRAEILGVAGVEAGGEAKAFAAQPADRPEPERSLRGHVHRVRLELVDARDGAPGIPRHPDLGVRREAERPVRVGRDHQHLGALRLQMRDETNQRVDDSVGLGPPSIGNERQPLHCDVLPTA
jgi:hypothetical protein